MSLLLTARQMKAAERAAIRSGRVSGLELMESAGNGVVEAVFEKWPEFAQSPCFAVVLCGPGNNGGDGYVVARLLKARGWTVEVYAVGEPTTLPKDALANFHRWKEVGEVLDISEARASVEGNTDLVFDAVFGTGLSRPIDDGLARLLEDCRQHAFVSIDMPSGIDADSGRLLGTRPILGDQSRELTVTFGRLKLGHVLRDGGALAEEVVVKSIGLTHRDFSDPETVKLVGKPKGLQKRVGHKYDHGHALVLSGPPGMGGAARLAARGALRVGAGLVTVACPIRGVAEHAGHLTAVMVRGVDGAPGLREALEDSRFAALCLGPGLGLGRSTHDLVMCALESGRSVVLDADALSRFQRSQYALMEALHENVVLTPHAGEFRRLFPDLAAKLEAPVRTGPAYSEVDAVREAAARAGCTVLLKGPSTVIASPDGICAVNASIRERAAPWLATAGSGDVLAGFITGLLARGFSPQKAAEAAAWLHTECALSFGPGLIAEDLPEQLPKVLAQVEPDYLPARATSRPST